MRAVSDRSDFGEPPDRVLVVPAHGGFPCGRRLRGEVVRVVVEAGGVVGQHEVEVGDVDVGLVPVDQARSDSRSCGRCQGCWGCRGRRRSDVRRAAPTPLGIERRSPVASHRGRSSSRSRRAGGRSRIANLGAAASPASTDAARGACRRPDASRRMSRAVRRRGRSSPPGRRRTAGRPWSGSAPARSDPRGRGAGGARSPRRDQRRSWYRDDRPRGARRRARSTRRWRLRQRAARSGRRRRPTARAPPTPSATFYGLPAQRSRQEPASRGGAVRGRRTARPAARSSGGPR